MISGSFPARIVGQRLDDRDLRPSLSYSVSDSRPMVAAAPRRLKRSGTTAKSRAPVESTMALAVELEAR